MTAFRSTIIDTDPGVDDALALIFAHSAPKLHVKGITTVFGNQTVEKTTRNACTIVDLLRAKTPVYRGTSKPLVKQALLAESHGDSGLGNYRKTGALSCEEPSTKPDVQDAVSFLASAIQPGMQIACMGPMTNIALLANLYPEALQRAERVVIMGGVFDQVGNTGPWAEFNVFNDPDAFAQVLALEKITKVIIPADICRLVTMDEEDFITAKDRGLSKAIREIVRMYVEYYRNDHICGEFAGGVMYDALVIAYLLWPELFNVEPRHVIIETGDGPARGATAVDPRRADQPNCLLVTRNKDVMPLGLDATEVKNRLLALLQ